MPRDERMFGDIVDPSVKVGNKQGYSVFGTIVLEVVIIDLATSETQRTGMYVETENNVPQWITDFQLLVNRQE